MDGKRSRAKTLATRWGAMAFGMLVLIVGMLIQGQVVSTALGAEGKAGDPVLAAGFCEATQANLDRMKRIHVKWDLDGYVAVMQDPAATCYDVNFLKPPPPPLPGVVVGVLAQFRSGFKDKPLCLVYKVFESPVKRFAGKQLFTWAPVPCNPEA